MTENKLTIEFLETLKILSCTQSGSVCIIFATIFYITITILDRKFRTI